MVPCELPLLSGGAHKVLSWLQRFSWHFPIRIERSRPTFYQYTSGLQRLAGVHDPPQSCDIPKEAEFYGDYHGENG